MAGFLNPSHTESTMSIETIVALSRRYGADPDYVIAGGGNTSFKNGETLFIKASGTSLAEMDAAGFVRLDRRALAAIWKKQYPADPEARETAILADMMAARLPGQENKRPSVEALLHDILPFAYVVHSHPALVNGLACSVQGKTAMDALFPEGLVWIPSINPGYILALAVKEALADFRTRHGTAPEIILLQNHGVFVGGDSSDRVQANYSRLMATIGARIGRHPDLSGAQAKYGASEAVAAELARLAAVGSAPGTSPRALFRRNGEIGRLTANRSAFAPVASPLTPDHIVYAGSDFLFVEDEKTLSADWERFVRDFGRQPKLVALRGMGVFGIGSTEKSAAAALDLFVDAARVVCYAEAFGGPQYMAADKIDFINNWEVERYRAKIHTDQRQGEGK